MINFVTETEAQRWILRPLAECLAKEIPGAKVSTVADPLAGFNVFFNYALYTPVGTKVAAWFTHREREGALAPLFDLVAKKVDWCFCPSRLTAELLPRDKTTVLPTFPTDSRFYKDLVLGVCGREYKSGRKRLGWIEDLRRIPHVRVELTGGKIPADKMPDFYRRIDYLVVLSDNEGGPQPVLEALASGCPVIAPNVGFCWEYPCLRYSTKEELMQLASRLVIPRDGWKASAKILMESLQQCA